MCGTERCKGRTSTFGLKSGRGGFSLFGLGAAILRPYPDDGTSLRIVLAVLALTRVGLNMGSPSGPTVGLGRAACCVEGPDKSLAQGPNKTRAAGSRRCRGTNTGLLRLVRRLSEPCVRPFLRVSRRWYLLHQFFLSLFHHPLILLVLRDCRV